MSSLLKDLLNRRLKLSLEQQTDDQEEKKEPVGDGGSTPDGAAVEPDEIAPETPIDEVPATEDVPSKEDEEEPGETPAEGGEEPAVEPESTSETEPAVAPETPNPDAGGAEPPVVGEEESESEFDEFDDEEDEDGAFDESDEEEYEEAIDELSEAQKADLAMVNLIVKVRDTLADGGLSGREAAMVADRAGAILGKVDMEPSPVPAQECFGTFGDRRNNTELALEALQEDQKAVEQKKEGILAKIMKFIRDTWNALFGGKERFKRQVAVASERVAKIGEKRTVVLKGSEGTVAAYAAMVNKSTFTCGELAMATDRLTAELSGLVSKFTAVAGNDGLEEDFVADLVGRTNILSHLGMNTNEYHEKTKEFSRYEITINVDPNHVSTMVTKFDNGYKAAEGLMEYVERVSKRACAAGNAKQLTEVLTLVRMFTNLTKSGPLLAIRLAVKGEDKPA